MLVILPGCSDSGGPGSPETERGTFLLGPFVLEPGEEDEGFATGIPRPDDDVGVRSMSVTVVDGEGNEISHHDVHLHHIVFHNAGKPDRVCPGKTERFGGAGGERTPIGPFPAGFAYPVSSTDRWDAVYHLMDLREAGSPEIEVFIAYTLEWISSGSAYRPLVPCYLDVTGCEGNSTYDVPGDGGPMSEHVKNSSWVSPVSGRCVYAVGHLHEGGIDLALTDQINGELVCRSDASYDEHGMLKMTTCSPDYDFTAGNAFILESRYRNDEPYEDVMGIMLVYLWEQ